MRTAARDRVPHIALRNCSKEVVGEGQYIYDFGEGGVHCNQALISQKVFC